MKRTPILLPGLYFLTAASLAAGYLRSRVWVILLFVLTISLLFFVARRRSVDQAASVLLAGAVVLASVGVIIQMSLILMPVGCIGALASWDIMLFSQTTTLVAKRDDFVLLDRRHYWSLAIAIGGGTLFSLTAGNLTLNLPFIMTLVLCAVALGGVYFGTRHIVEIERQVERILPAYLHTSKPVLLGSLTTRLLNTIGRTRRPGTNNHKQAMRY